MSAPESRAPRSHLRHDLRTPLNQILGYSELLLEEAAGAAHAHDDPARPAPSALSADLQKIRHAAKNLLNLINENLTDDRLSLVGDIVDRGDVTASPFTFTGTRSPSRHAPAQTDPASEPDAELIHPAADVSAQLAHSASDTAAARPAAVPGRILVVDDNDANRDMLCRQLSRQGHSVASVADGQAALDRLRAEPFDLVLLDMMMPVLDGYSTLRALKEDPALRHLPVIMISALDELAAVVRCIERGAEDFLPKPFNPTLLRARIGAGLEKKRFRDQEALYVRTIEQTQARLQAELTEAENYVRSILPPAGLSRTIPVDWRLIPSTELGGDSFGYHWIDDDHFALYLLDVCGHGVGAALLSVTAINVLRNAALPGVDFRDPGAMLTALNEAFLMEKQNDMYFTIWYGVWQVSTRTLHYSTAGHPPSLLVSPISDAPSTVEPLKGAGMILGGMEGMVYRTFTRAIPGPARLYVVSDGTFEIQRADGTMWPDADFHAFFTRPFAPGESELDALFAHAKSLHGPGPLDDDFSLVRFDL
ncbi:MAG: SpoIIE family protein phosphatase [Burkholderiales bacterium]|nr:SpoIIE family protein phosphatase [Opitutaceae bacterium]